jgi:aryl-alcohol dehydrogenase-like predicted oxidoreductase
MMEYVKLGRTGLEVSRICLGCMSYGVPDQGNHAWSIDEAESRPFIKRALEGGINFFDTANRYSLGVLRENAFQGIHQIDEFGRFGDRTRLARAARPDSGLGSSLG